MKFTPGTKFRPNSVKSPGIISLSVKIASRAHILLLLQRGSPPGTQPKRATLTNATTTVRLSDRCFATFFYPNWGWRFIWFREAISRIFGFLPCHSLRRGRFPPRSINKVGISRHSQKQFDVHWVSLGSRTQQGENCQRFPFSLSPPVIHLLSFDIFLGTV